MQVNSNIVSKRLRHELEPMLRRIGFSRFQGRRAYRYDTDCVIGFSTRAVGSHFSRVTGFPASSFGSIAWVHYDFIPSFEQPSTTSHRPFCPKVSHFAEDLKIVSPRQKEIRRCNNETEQDRDDLWWVEPDGSNLADTVQDVRNSIEAQAVPWWESMLQIQNALNLTSMDHDCPRKSFHMYYLAKHLRRADIVKQYEQEVGNKTDPGSMRSV